MRVSAATLGLVALADYASADLHSLAVAAGKQYFGTATDNGELQDSAYTAITRELNNFGSITPANGQKWDFVEPTQNGFRYTYADVVPNFARANGQAVRCHTLLYRSQTPTWVTGGSWSKAQMTSIITTHIKNVVGHYKGQCYSWDVVNEAVDDEGNYRETVFQKVLGLDHLTLAFTTAHEVDPAAKLYYNDYNIENPNPKQKKTVELVKYIQDAGAPIHGVGLQGHFIVGSMPSQDDLETVIKDFAALDVDVAYTEVDVKFTSLPYTAAGLEAQADAYVSVINACLNVERCVGWTIWDWTDKYSWVPGTFPGQGGACLFDKDLKPKPAYSAVSSALAAAATKGSSSTKVSSTVAATSTPVTSKASSAVVSASTSEASSEASSTAAAVPSTTAIEATPIANSSVIASPTSIAFSSVVLSSATSKTLNATAIYTNGTATATNPAGGLTTITSGASATIPADDVLTTAVPGSGTIPVETVPGTASGDVPAPTGNPGDASPSYVVSTVYETNIYTLTACPPTVQDCPGKIGSATTEIAAFTTTVWASSVPSAPAAVKPTAPAAEAPISKCERKRLRRMRRRLAKAAARKA
ncbi:Endo-1,4-beta-xylanase 1-like protein 3 [Colletotrichum plurivorum]|uniref:Beta-xylanase n=1 Tax=Colletotrichum plurivorum TaxID=2175906 RepID=A0A8H6NM33_9PEZI|nr:Endo-1,4-beta-xylanase 1-like protein 3 [Colletotrichum plurivorum]